MSEKNLGNLAERVSFLTISCGRFGNVRKSNVELNTTANHSRFATNKKLLVSPELKQIAKRDEEVKHQVEAYLLPFKAGISMLPNANGQAVKKILEEYKKIERPSLVKAFVMVYKSQVETATVELKEEFVAADYKPVEAVAAEFDFDYLIWSLNLPDELKDKAAETIMEAAATVADALTLAAHECVSKLADSLSANEDGKPKKLYDKQFVKLQEFLAGFDIKNVVDSKELKAEMDKLKALMAGVDPNKVRENEGLRANIATKMSEATASLTAMVQHKGRKFRDAEPVEAV